MIPFLRPDEDLGDPAILRTWHEALSSALAFDLPHDLFALWAYAGNGRVVLLGPEELSADQLAVPAPAPAVRPEQLRALDDVVRQAGYRSVMTQVVRHEGADVGLMLFAALGADLYLPLRRHVAADVAVRIAPTLAYMAREQGALHSMGMPHPTEHADAGWVAAVAAALSTAGDLAEATRRIAAEAGAVLAFDELQFSLRMAEADRVVVLTPGETRPLLDLPLVPIATGTLSRIVSGEERYLIIAAESRRELIVPLRVAGRILGAMTLTTSGVFESSDVMLAQQLADIAAPHLELFRRAELGPVAERGTARRLDGSTAG